MLRITLIAALMAFSTSSIAADCDGSVECLLDEAGFTYVSRSAEDAHGHPLTYVIQLLPNGPLERARACDVLDGVDAEVYMKVGDEVEKC